MGDNLLGSHISLISQAQIRYEGILQFINMEESSISLQNVRSFGTEGRRMDGPQVPVQNEVYEAIVFKVEDIKDLTVLDLHPSQQMPEPAPPPQPVVQAPEPSGWKSQPPAQAPQTYAPLYGAGNSPWGAPPAPAVSKPPAPSNAEPPKQPAAPPSAPAPAAAPTPAPSQAPKPAAPSVAPVMSVTPAQAAAPPAPPSSWAAAAGGGPRGGVPNAGRGRGPGRGPGPSPAPGHAPYTAPGVHRPAGPAAGPGHQADAAGAQGAPRPGPPRAPTTIAAPTVTVPKEDFDFQAFNAKFKKDEVAKEAEEVVRDGVYKKDDFFDMLSCEALGGGGTDYRGKMMEQKKIDMETFGGLGAVRHHSNSYNSHGRGRGGVGVGPGPAGRGPGAAVPGRGYGYSNDRGPASAPSNDRPSGYGYGNSNDRSAGNSYSNDRNGGSGGYGNDRNGGSGYGHDNRGRGRGDGYRGAAGPRPAGSGSYYSTGPQQGGRRSDRPVGTAR